MATRGSSFDAGPDACPFIALELDRDRRSERPDYRHRCYAEQVPAPRTIAHQERYCLSPNFSGCPIFQDWALRAAARPVPLPAGYEGRRGASDARAAATGAALAGAASAGPADEPVWPDSMDAASAAAAAAAASSVADDGGEAQQLGAFDGPPAQEPELQPEPASDFEPEPEPELDHFAAAVVATGGAALMSDDDEPFPPDVEPRSPETESGGLSEAAEVAPVPAFLAARSARPKTPVKVDEPITREEVVPSWELTDRYGAQASGRGERESSGGGDGTFSKILTAVAVVIIIALGIAAVVLVPGLLNGTPGTTPRPSLALASRSPLNTIVAGVESPTVAPATPVITAEPTAGVTAGPTPRTYRVKSGDTFAKIAKKFKITVAALEAANPQIGNADHIEIGQILIIPLREN